MTSPDVVRDNRRDVRYKVQIPAVLIRGKSVLRYRTEDVSFRGVFLRTDDPPSLRQLVQIRLTLPPDNAEVAFHGMAVHVVRPEEAKGRCPGVGIQFYAADGAERVRWETFIRAVRSELGAGRETPVNLAPAGAPDPVRRKYPRIDAKLRLWVSSLGQIHRCYSENLSRGGMLIATDVDFEVNSRLQMMLMHPSDGSGFPMEAIVRRKVTEENFRGVGVEIVAMNAERERAFFAFLGSDVWVSIDLDDLAETPEASSPMPQVLSR